MGNRPVAGISCPVCQHGGTHVYDTRHVFDQVRGHGYIWRRRQCKQCDERFSTKESLVVSRARTVRTAHEDALDVVLELVHEIDALVDRLKGMRAAITGTTDAPEAPPA